MTTEPRRIGHAMRRDALLASAFFRAMRPEDIDQILGFAIERRYPRGTAIFSKGDPGTSMLAVLAGRVRVNSVSPDGREVTINSIGPGEVVGEIALLDGRPRSAGATAAEDTTVLVIERRHFMPLLLKNEVMVERLLVVLCDRLRRTSASLEELALFDLPMRLARLLLKLSNDYGRPVHPEDGGGTRIDMKLSQRDLSTLVASSRESVNKLLRNLREDGVIDMADGYIILRQPKSLQQMLQSS
ncbi:MAG: Crp/Fnr family transcriptional regulator [Acidisphaera sp.]|nr:Crp/Fnr family transcriptional regulator [Acidisphaera sp.]MBV9813966.1 Crp/Fnr family transcriptional regulator [Acetobacteraceae bacterium]